MKTLFLTFMLAFSAVLSARTVTLEQVVCNPSSTITVPITLDNAEGLAVVSLVVGYDPMVLVLQSVQKGSLKSHFSFDFSVVEGSGAVNIIAVAPENITVPASGSIAELCFYVRPGSASLTSNLALTDVQFSESTMTVDLTVDDPISPQSGEVRAFATTGICTSRHSSKALCVAPETQLAELVLNDGDALQASVNQNEPIAIEKLSASGTIRVLPPDGGWTTATYTLLTCDHADVTLEIVDAPESCTLASTTEGMCTTYTVTTEVQRSFSVEGNIEEQRVAQLCELLDITNAGLTTLGESFATVLVEGTAEDVALGLDLGIVPETEVKDGILRATFKPPKLEIVGFDVERGVVRAKVIPPENAELRTSNNVSGIIHIYGTSSLSNASSLSKMTEITAKEIDLSPYLERETKGELEIIVQFGTNTFFRVTAGD